MKPEFIPAAIISISPTFADEIHTLIAAAKNHSCAVFEPILDYPVIIIESKVLQEIIMAREFAKEVDKKIFEWLEADSDHVGWKSLRLIYLDYDRG